ncbi:hypothetical protein GCM10023100_76900 [Actinocorallia cavernae]|uniref:HTH arsR-type domain-containing protein n=2 Tax=Actinomycetes TaxID=1760 RepID=A0ABP8T7U0_9ACTN
MGGERGDGRGGDGEAEARGELEAGEGATQDMSRGEGGDERGWQPVRQYPVAEPSPSEPVSLETVTPWLKALAHPVRLRLPRTLARGAHTTGELAHARGLSAPEVSRRLAALRRAGLLTARREGRYVRYTVNLPDLTALGSDVLEAVLR